MYFIGTSIIKNGEITSLSEQEETGHDNEVYELLRIQNRKPLFITEHLNRFRNTLKTRGISLDCIDRLPGLIDWLILCNPQTDCDMRLVVSPQGLFQAGYVTSHYPTKQMYENGVKASILEAIRENPEAKIYHADMRTSAQSQQEKQGTYESVLVTPQGIVTEGSRSNVFFIRDGEVYNTPDEFVLGGIMRLKIIEICKRLGINVKNATVSINDINKFEAAFFSSTPMRILPISSIGDTCYKLPNETLSRIMAEMDSEIKKQIQ